MTYHQLMTGTLVRATRPIGLQSDGAFFVLIENGLSAIQTHSAAVDLDGWYGQVGLRFSLEP